MVEIWITIILERIQEELERRKNYKNISQEGTIWLKIEEIIH